MNEVDKLIEKLAIHISAVVSIDRSGTEITEKTKALAELITARAKLLAVEKEPDVKSIEELAVIVSEHPQSNLEGQLHLKMPTFEIFQGTQKP